MKKLNALFPYALLLLLAVAPAAPLAGTYFLNDDLQILTGAVNSGNIFSGFWQPEVWQYYWRPLLLLYYKLLYAAAGLDPLVFRAGGLALYAVLSVVFYRFLLSAGINKNTSLAVSMVFVLLPSHELNMAWISDQSELLAGIFILCALQAYRRAASGAGTRWHAAYYGCAAAALLSKEIALTVFLVPLAACYLYPRVHARGCKPALADAAKTLLLILLMLLYRYLVIGHLPAGSGHTDGVTVQKVLVNYLLYLPFAFITPEMAEQLYAAAWVTVPVILALFAAALFVLYRQKQVLAVSGKQFAGALMLYTVFVVPVLPTFMRWYAFIPSFGILLAAALLLNRRYPRTVVFVPAVLLCVILSVYRVQVFSIWRHAGGGMEQLGRSIRQELSGGDTTEAVIIGVPDKINRVSFCKNGISETFSYFAGRQLAIEAPVRCEVSGSNARFSLSATPGQAVTLTAYGARFLRAGGRSTSIITAESDTLLWRGIAFYITTVPQRGVPVSRVRFTLPDDVRPGQLFYYDGSGIQPLRGNQPGGFAGAISGYHPRFVYCRKQ